MLLILVCALLPKQQRSLQCHRVWATSRARAGAGWTFPHILQLHCCTRAPRDRAGVGQEARESGQPRLQHQLVAWLLNSPTVATLSRQSSLPAATSRSKQKHADAPRSRAAPAALQDRSAGAFLALLAELRLLSVPALLQLAIRHGAATTSAQPSSNASKMHGGGQTRAVTWALGHLQPHLAAAYCCGASLGQKAPPVAEAMQSMEAWWAERQSACDDAPFALLHLRVALAGGKRLRCSAQRVPKAKRKRAASALHELGAERAGTPLPGTSTDASREATPCAPPKLFTERSLSQKPADADNTQSTPPSLHRRVLGRAVLSAAEAIAGALQAGALQAGALQADASSGVASGSPEAVERACASLRPWQQRLLSAWLICQLPHLCPACMKGCHALSSLHSVAVWNLLQSAGPREAACQAPAGASQPAGTASGKSQAEAQRSSEAVRRLLAADSDSAPLLRGPSVTWVLGLVSLLCALRADVHATLLAAALAVASVASAAAGNTTVALRAALALVESVSAALAALGVAELVAGALRNALQAGASASTTRAVMAAAAHLRGAAAGGAAEQATSVEADATSAHAQLDAQLDAQRVARSDSSNAAVKSAVDAMQARLEPVMRESPASAEAAEVSSHALQGLLRRAPAQLAGAADVAAAAVGLVARLATSVPALSGAALKLVVPRMLDAVDATLLDVPAPAVAAALVAAVAEAVGAAGDNHAAMAAAAAVLPAAVARGLLAFDAAAALARARYESGAAGSHIVAAALFGDPAHPDSPLEPARCLLTTGVASALGARQRRLPPAALRAFFGAPGAKRSVLADALSAPGAAGRRARVAADAALACDATRLALLDADGAMSAHGAHLAGAATATKVAPRWAAAVALRAGRAVPMADVALADFAAVQERMFAQARPAASAHADAAVAAALAQAAVAPPVVTAVSRPASAGPAAAPGGAQALACSFVAGGMAAAIAAEPAAGALLLAAATAPTQAPPMARALFAAVSARAPGVLATQPGSSPPLSRAPSHEGSPASAATSSAPESAESRGAYVETYLQLLCRMDTATWRERADAIVSQMCAAADAMCVRVDTREAADCGEGARQAHEDELALCLDLLMPLLPIVYNASASGAAASKSARVRLADALARLLASGARAQLGRHNAAGPAELRERMLTVLHALASDEWARWITCHQTRGKPQAVGPLLDTAGVAAAVRRAPARAAATAELAAAADVEVHCVNGYLAMHEQQAAAGVQGLARAQAQGNDDSEQPTGVCASVCVGGRGPDLTGMRGAETCAALHC
jgi:hypothetical protein